MTSMLNGKTALVTGSSRGIGRTTARGTPAVAAASVGPPPGVLRRPDIPAKPHQDQSHTKRLENGSGAC
jgi:hypothetical protein